jgi:hypothetical protein
MLGSIAEGCLILNMGKNVKVNKQVVGSEGEQALDGR